MIKNSDNEWEISHRLKSIVLEWLESHAIGMKIHQVFVVPTSLNSYETLVFFVKESDANRFRNSTHFASLEGLIGESLVQILAVSGADVKASLEVDSHEKVEENFQGNYGLRLHG